MPDIELAYKTITAKRPTYDEAYSYYDGEAELKYSTERIQIAFENFDAYFAQNWLAVIVMSVLDRLTLKGFTVNNNAKATAWLAETFDRLNLQLTAYDVHEAAAVTSEAFIIVENDENGADAYFNDPRLCHMFYDPARPRHKLFAAKNWQSADGSYHMALYYPNRTEFYTSAKPPRTYKAYTLERTEANDTGVIPVFHFRATRRGVGEYGKSERSMQDAVNKLFSDMMVASELTSLKQRVIISQANPGDLKTFENWYIPARETSEGQDTSVQELGGADLTLYLKAIDGVAFALGVITRTPKHYFYQTGGDPSGDALHVMEAPLLKKVLQRRENLSVTWHELASYLLELDGSTVPPTDIVSTWEPVETIQPYTRAQILQTETGAGVPLAVSAKRAGWADDEIKQLGTREASEEA